MSPIRRRSRVLVALVVMLATAALLMALGPWWSWPAAWAIRGEMRRRKIPGLSVAVAVGGRLRWSAGFGRADVEQDVPARRTTVYRMASISKPITAVGVLHLAERGRLDLDAPIQRYVPSFPEKPWPVTPRLLLAHLGGIRHYQGVEAESVRHYPDVTEPLAIFQDDPLVAEPGTKFLYSTWGYNLLGAAIEGASGRSYLGYMRANVFGPAGMTRAREADIDAIIPGRARGYILAPDGMLRNSRPADLSNKIPGAGLCSTAEDLARFAVALLEDRLLKPETRRLMWTRLALKNGLPVDYGLGWRLSRYEDQREVWHAGMQQRVSAMLYLQPDRGVVVALMCNLEGADLMPLAREIAWLAAPWRSRPSPPSDPPYRAAGAAGRSARGPTPRIPPG